MWLHFGGDKLSNAGRDYDVGEVVLTGQGLSAPADQREILRGEGDHARELENRQRQVSLVAKCSQRIDLERGFRSSR